MTEERGGRTAESVTTWSDSVGVENCSSLAQGLTHEVTYALFSPQNIGLCNVVFFFKNECLILKKHESSGKNPNFFSKSRKIY